LKETYQIAILAKKKFFPDESFTHTFLYYDPDNGIPLGGKTRIITVELVKTEPVADKPVEEMTNAELWAVFFQYLTEKEKRGTMIEIINREEGIAMALDTLVNITQDEREYAYMTSLLKGELDWQSGMAEAREEGLNEGRQEGLNEGLAEGLEKGHTEKALEIARKMKNAGRPLGEIAEFTGLPAETIEKMSNE
jgi:predicted transposase/invertase (TIGR01784 family)